LATKKQTRRQQNSEEGRILIFCFGTDCTVCVRACVRWFSLRTGLMSTRSFSPTCFGFSSTVPFVPVCSFCLWFLPLLPRSLHTYVECTVRSLGSKVEYCSYHSRLVKVNCSQ
jgi:hypothetical protein